MNNVIVLQEYRARKKTAEAPTEPVCIESYNDQYVIDGTTLKSLFTVALLADANGIHVAPRVLEALRIIRQSQHKSS
jgi:hypothetical protein